MNAIHIQPSEVASDNVWVHKQTLACAIRFANRVHCQIQVEDVQSEEIQRIDAIARNLNRYLAVLGRVLAGGKFVDEEVAPRLLPLVSQLALDHNDTTDLVGDLSEVFMALRKPHAAMLAAAKGLEEYRNLIQHSVNSAGHGLRGLHTHGTATIKGSGTAAPRLLALED